MSEVFDPSQEDWEDSISWDDEELEAPACDLSNPEVCESCQ